MARTKQTVLKTTADGKLPPKTTAGDTPALQSPGGQSLAVFPQRSAHFLDSDLKVEQAVRMFGLRSLARSTRSQTPGSSPARGSLARSNPQRSP